MAERIADPVSIPTGDSLCAIRPGKMPQDEHQARGVDEDEGAGHLGGAW